jgi:hypothetical protein
MSAEPMPVAVTRPALFTVATPRLEDDQVKEVAPSVDVAVYWAMLSGNIESTAVVTRTVGVACVGAPPPPAQAVSMAAAAITGVIELLRFMHPSQGAGGVSVRVKVDESSSARRTGLKEAPVARCLGTRASA